MNKDDLDDIYRDIWQRITRGKADRKSPFHNPVVGTADGSMRVMVLRNVNVETSTIRFHTDMRSGKIAKIGDKAPVSVLFYDAQAKVQIRASGIGRIEQSGETADSAWARSPNTSRRCYLAHTGPGTIVDAPTSGLPERYETTIPTLEETEAGRANFAILLITLNRLEWLYLAHDGHRRAAFERDGDVWQGHWLVP
jgi:pyridoxamine 5'-phosphate oxidase